MASFTDLTGLAGVALALAAIACMPLAKRVAPMVAGVIFLLLLLPIGDFPVAGYVRGMVGDVSITTLSLLAYAHLRRAGAVSSSSARRRVGALLLLLVAVAVLYPLALGAAPYDSYRWGYGDPWFLGFLLALTLAAVALRMPLVALPISLSVLAWAVGWYESDNLWDYLIDPLLAVYGATALLRGLLLSFCPRGVSAQPPSGA